MLYEVITIDAAGTQQHRSVVRAMGFTHGAEQLANPVQVGMQLEGAKAADTRNVCEALARIREAFHDEPIGLLSEHGLPGKELPVYVAHPPADVRQAVLPGISIITFAEQAEDAGLAGMFV